MKGYRTEQLYGESYIDATSVMAHEVFELQNTDILDTLSNGLFINTEIGKKLKQLSNIMNDDANDDAINKFLDDAFENEEIGIEYFAEILQEIKNITGKDIKYVLWLCDTIEDIKAEYGEEFTCFDEYETSDIILSDIGKAGKLYGYEKEPWNYKLRTIQ